MEVMQGEPFANSHGDFVTDFVNEYSDNALDQNLGNLSYDFPPNGFPDDFFIDVPNSLQNDVSDEMPNDILANLPNNGADYLLDEFTGSHFDAFYDQSFGSVFNPAKSVASDIPDPPLSEPDLQVAIVQHTETSTVNDVGVLSLDTISTMVPGFHSPKIYASMEGQKLGLSATSAAVDLECAMGNNPTGNRQSMLSETHRDQVCTNGWRQRQVVTSDVWEDVRPFIEQLYLVEEIDLKSLIRILEINLGFTATEQMYKKRLKSWGYRKYYKASEKEALARAIRTRQQHKVKLTDLTLRNRPVKLDRVRRFCKHQKLFEEVVDNLDPLSSSASTGDDAVIVSQQQRSQRHRVPKQAGHQVAIIEPQRPFSVISDEGRVEIILLQTKAYLGWKHAGVDGIMTEDNQHLFFQKWRDGVQLLQSHKQAQGMQQIQAGCDAFLSTLTDPRQPTLADILNCFSVNSWSRFVELRNHLLRFLTKAAGVTFGANHPLSMIFFHVQDQHVFDQASTMAMNVLIDVSAQSPATDQLDLHEMRLDFCTVLIQHEQLDSAENYIKRFLLEAETLYGYDSPQARQMLASLGLCDIWGGDHSAAISSYEEALVRAKRDLQHNFPDRDCISVFCDLAYLYEQTADFARCQDYWYRFVEELILLQWMDEDWAMRYIVALEDTFLRNGWDAGHWFQQNFNISLAEYWERNGWE